MQNVIETQRRGFGPCWRHQRPRYRRDLALSCSAASRLLVSSKRTTSALFTGRPVSFASLSAYLSSRLSSASSSLNAVIFFESAITISCSRQHPLHLHRREGSACPRTETLGHEFARYRPQRQALPTQPPCVGQECLLARLRLEPLSASGQPEPVRHVTTCVLTLGRLVLKSSRSAFPDSLALPLAHRRKHVQDEPAGRAT